MSGWHSRMALVAGALILVGTVVTPSAALAAAPPPPQSDPFYTPPAGYAASAPGTVLRSRQVTAAAFGALPQHASAWQDRKSVV